MHSSILATFVLLLAGTTFAQSPADASSIVGSAGSAISSGTGVPASGATSTTSINTASISSAESMAISSASVSLSSELSSISAVGTDTRMSSAPGTRPQGGGTTVTGTGLSSALSAMSASAASAFSSATSSAASSASAASTGGVGTTQVQALNVVGAGLLGLAAFL